jgi:methionyl-tRNA formyltransferase
MDKNISHNLLPLHPTIVFMGTPQFAVPTLETIIRERYGILSVVTQPDRPKGRGQRLTPSPVKVVALEHNLFILQPERLDDRFLNTIKNLKPDLLVVIAFGQIIPEKVLNSATWGGINIHASLLPKYRGSAPIQWAIINNEKITGLTTMFMDEGMDTGPILMQEEVDIMEGETAGELHDRMAALAPGLLIKTLQGLAEGTVKEIAQDDSLATYAPKLTKEQGLIDWTKPAEHLYGLIRGLDPWPGALTYYGGTPVKVFRPMLGDISSGYGVPGRVKNFSERGLEVETGMGTVIVREFQSPGRKRISAREFMQGTRIAPGDFFGK